MLSGDNSILQKATDAKQTSERAEAKEQAQMDIMEYIADKTANHQDASLDDTKVKGILTGKSYVKTVNDTSFITAKGEYVIPYSELYHSNISTNNDDDPPDDTEYPYRKPYIPAGFSHTGTEDWNHGYTITGNAGTDNAGDEFVWVPCVLDQDKVKTGDTVQTFQKHFDGMLYNSLTSDTSKFSDEGDTAGIIRTSVGKYGGFYIAKYEAGKKDGNEKPLSQSGKNVWDNITRTDAIASSNLMIRSITGIKSTLISGECWDTTLQWIKNTADSTYDEDSTGKGYYSIAKNDGTSGMEIERTEPTNTGYYAINNIYDMAGNSREYTTENVDLYGMKFVIGRGGDYSTSGEGGYSAASRHGNPNGPANQYTGFRVVMYKE